MKDSLVVMSSSGDSDFSVFVLSEHLLVDVLNPLEKVMLASSAPFIVSFHPVDC
jgi:hypothetical protein